MLLRRLGAQLGLFDEPSAAPAPPASAATPSQEGSSSACRHQVQLSGQTVPYELQRARRSSIGFAVGPEGLRVRAPRWVNLTDIEKALLSKGDWILRQLGHQQQRQQQQALMRVNWGEGASLPYLGAPLRVERGAITQLVPARDETPARLLLRLPAVAQESQWRDATQAWLQQQARQLFAERLTFFAEQAGVATPRLRLSSAKGRWGSASSQGVVSLNWRLMHFSQALIDYVVAHEVAHLREMNHGPRFWALVGELMPGFEDRREALKKVELPGF
jgi:predicted metal-dependent hydrolase